MIRSFGIALCALALGAASAGAVIVEVPLPALQGTYGWSSPSAGSRTAAFTLPHTPSVIHSVSIRLRGSTTVGQIDCDFGPRVWGCMFFSEMIGAASGGWVTDYSQSAPSGGAFESTLAYEGWSFPPSPPVSWSFLSDGQGELSLMLTDTNPLMCAELTAPPNGVIEEATLIVDMDFAVAARPRSWGQVKLAYR